VHTSKSQHSLLLSPPQAAEILGVTVATLATWRCTGRVGIPFVRIGRAVKYRVADLEAWIDANRIVPGEAVDDA